LSLTVPTAAKRQQNPNDSTYHSHKLTDNAKYASSSADVPSLRSGIYPLTLLHARLNALPVCGGAAAESSVTLLAQRKLDIWARNELAVFADIAA
jgi:hypothetical protein